MWPSARDHLYAQEFVYVQYVCMCVCLSLPDSPLISSSSTHSQSLLDSVSPSEWQLALVLRTFPLHSVLANTDERLKTCRETQSIQSRLTPPLFNSPSMSLHVSHTVGYPSLPLLSHLHLFFNLPSICLSLDSLVKWHECSVSNPVGVMSPDISSWCGGLSSSANDPVQTRIWYGGYEDQMELLWANKEILILGAVRERVKETDMERDACTHTHTHKHKHTHIHKHTHTYTHIDTHSITLVFRQRHT